MRQGIEEVVKLIEAEAVGERGGGRSEVDGVTEASGGTWAGGAAAAEPSAGGTCVLCPSIGGSLEAEHLEAQGRITKITHH